MTKILFCLWKRPKTASGSGFIDVLVSYSTLIASANDDAASSADAAFGAARSHGLVWETRVIGIKGSEDGDNKQEEEDEEDAEDAR